jgi:outer membrane protein OmpA-like peptidoglycan-associated protein
MKKAILISTLITSTIFNAGFAKADASKEENIGVASGALTGAAIAGPIGFIIGSAIGGLIGSEVEKGGQLTMVQQELNASTERENHLKQELTIIQENIDFKVANTHSVTDIQWMTDGLTLNLMFTTGSSDLSDNGFNSIKQIATVLKKFPQLKLKLDGYADPRGSLSSNMKLSQNRVDGVKAAFEMLNISADRIICKAHGEAEGFTNDRLTHESKGDAFALARKVSMNFIAEATGQVAQN